MRIRQGGKETREAEEQREICEEGRAGERLGDPITAFNLHPPDSPDVFQEKVRLKEQNAASATVPLLGSRTRMPDEA